MIYVATGTALLIVATVTLIARSRHRQTTFVPRHPEPFAFANVRVLRDDDEVRAVADRAYAREQTIADAAQRRAARFGQLTRQHRPNCETQLRRR